MFNKETEYALRSLVYIQAQNNIKRRPGIIEIAKEIDAHNFLRVKRCSEWLRMVLFPR